MAKDKDQQQPTLPPLEKTNMPKDSEVKNADKIKLRRAYGFIEGVGSNLEQVKDILKGSPEQAPAILDKLKHVDTTVEDILTTLGY